ncbi:unnamed protein product [Penicillium roqueforti FM164]|uniref:Genomic scaffold, ProqFM164S01 n=1 Tax=Penicillium roqueforti (strain FM164) TaxID=1365484 RepID=W6QB67_PENRF|nr:unnamed protein product [Penicillium roqueforti FM164]
MPLRIDLDPFKCEILKPEAKFVRSEHLQTTLDLGEYRDLYDGNSFMTENCAAYFYDNLLPSKQSIRILKNALRA